MTPAAGGTLPRALSSKLKAAALPTTRSPSYAASARSHSRTDSHMPFASSLACSEKPIPIESRKMRRSPSKGRTSISTRRLWRGACSMIRPMFPISDENERGHGPAFVSLAFIAMNVLVFLFLQGAGASNEGAEFTYGYSAVPFEITNNVDLVEDETITVDGELVPI